MPFEIELFSGYAPQRTHPASFRGEPPSTDGARIFIFQIDRMRTPEIPEAVEAVEAVVGGQQKRVHATVKHKPTQVGGCLWSTGWMWADVCMGSVLGPNPFCFACM